VPVGERRTSDYDAGQPKEANSHAASCHQNMPPESSAARDAVVDHTASLTAFHA